MFSVSGEECEESAFCFDDDVGWCCLVGCVLRGLERVLRALGGGRRTTLLGGGSNCLETIFVLGVVV